MKMGSLWKACVFTLLVLFANSWADNEKVMADKKTLMTLLGVETIYTKLS